jgi:heptosyltransferase-2
MAATENILVRGVNWLGDAVMTTPALRRLREAKPGARITLLTHEKLVDLWREHPAVDAVLTFKKGESVWSIGRRLRGERFDLALLFPNSPRTAIEIFLGRIPERIGYARNGRSLLLTRALHGRPEQARMKKRTLAEIQRRIAAKLPRESYPDDGHHVHEYLQLVASIGGNPAPLPPLLSVKPEEIGLFKGRFGLDDNAPLFGLNAGAEYGPAKRWPAERFIDAAMRIHKQTGCHWILFGGKGDGVVTAKIESALASASGMRVTNVAGRTSLRELCAGLAACSVVLTNDTGPMHVANALGAPVVVPFGSTSPELTGPWSDGSKGILVGNVSCAPCFLRECPIDFRCMHSIQVEEVVEATVQCALSNRRQS